MGTESRTTDSGLTERAFRAELEQDACSFEFFQAVALLAHLSADRRPVGKFSAPESEAARFQVNPRLVFPASQIQSLEFKSDGRAEVSVNFMGLTGAMGVLPHPYSELILERHRAKDSALSEFFEIFNHRIISLFYRAWERYRYSVNYQRGERDLFTGYLRDLLGIGTSGLAERQQIDDEAMMPFTALYALQSRSAAALEQILSSYFEVPVEIQQFVGAWYGLERSNQCEMGETESISCQLGLGATAGDAVWDCQGRVRIRIGPVSLDRYNEFLPEGPAHKALRAITEFFANDCIDFEAQLVLDRNEVPAVTLDWGGEQPPRLGWVSWAKTRGLETDPDDTILNL
jgi:type VI secretion system protein ImpH